MGAIMPRSEGRTGAHVSLDHRVDDHAEPNRPVNTKVASPTPEDATFGTPP